MKKYRVMFRPTDNANDLSARTQEVYADGWRVDSDKVVLYAHETRRGPARLRHPEDPDHADPGTE